MDGLNRVMLIGRLGRDPETSTTQNGNVSCRFSIATDFKWTDKDGQRQQKTDWHRVIAWGKLAELCGEHLGKGRLVFCEGRNSTRKYQAKDGTEREITEVVVNTVQFLDSRGAKNAEGAPSPQFSASPAFGGRPREHGRQPGQGDDDGRDRFGLEGAYGGGRQSAGRHQDEEADVPF